MTHDVLSRSCHLWTSVRTTKVHFCSLGFSGAHLGEGEEREAFEEELVLLALEAEPLSLEDPRGRDGADAHAVADEEDAIVCCPGFAVEDLVGEKRRSSGRVPVRAIFCGRGREGGPLLIFCGPTSSPGKEDNSTSVRRAPYQNNRTVKG